MKMTLEDARKRYVKSCADYAAGKATFEQGQVHWRRVVRLREAAIRKANANLTSVPHVRT